MMPSQELQDRRMVYTRSVISLDPGRLSGVVRGQVSREGELHIDYFEEIEFTPNSLYRFLAHNDPDVLVCERFSYRPKHRTEDKLDLYPCFLIGICLLWQEQHTAHRLIFQEAAEGKGGYYGKDTTLNELGVYYKGGKGHARDATRHILHWFYEGAGFQFNQKGVHNLQLTKDVQTEKQKHPTRRKPRNDGEIKF
jgi:hypothetical protein